jgi:phospholipase C
MKENHSYDNYFGMLERGDGFTLGADGLPLNSNPDSAGQPVRAHHLSLPFNPSFDVSQTWNNSHRQWNGGAMDGFVTTTNSNEPMGYLPRRDRPAVVLRVRAHVRNRGPLLLLGAGANVPQPPLYSGRDRFRACQ